MASPTSKHMLQYDTQHPDPQPQGELFAGRFRLERMLGVGGMGSVKLALDLQTGRRCALKLLHQELLCDGDRTRFRREFRAAARLRHPFCLPVYDLGQGESTEGPRWYYSMEYLAGGSLAGLLEAGPVAPRIAAAIAAQVLAALDHIHARGIVHRDIKPENILLVSRAGEDVPQIKLADFGIAQVADSRDEVGLGHLMGSLPYLAPEQAEDGRVDLRGDLYAVGIVLYQMLSGHLPFSAHSPTEWVRLHREVAPPPPGAGTPPALSAVLEPLLAKDPAARPRSAAEPYDALCRFLREADAPPLPTHPLLERTPALFTPRFTGRVEEEARGLAFLDQIAQGPALLALRGEAGVGKSRLLGRLLQRGLSRGYRILPGTCRAEPDVPFAPLAELLLTCGVLEDVAGPAPDDGLTLSTLIGGLTRGMTEAVQGWTQAMLQSAVPQPLAPGVPAPAEDPIDGPATEGEDRRWLFQRQVTDAVLPLCVAQPGQPVTPLLIVVEDAHWSDLPTLQLLAALLRAAGEAGAALGVLVTLRPDPPPPAMQALLSLGQVVDLGPLGRDAAGALLSSMLGAPVADALRDALLVSTQGNPLYLSQALHLLFSMGRLRPGTAGVALDGDEASTLVCSVRDAIGERAARLSTGTKRALTAAAVLGRRFAPHELALVLRLGPEDELLLLDWLDEAIRAGFLDDDGFTHDRIRDALYERLPVSERTTLHRAAADAIEKARGPVPEAAAELARHLLACGDAARAYPYVIQAAEHAYRRHAYNQAADGFEQAIALIAELPEGSVSAEERGALIGRSADACLLADRLLLARQRCEERLRDPSDLMDPQARMEIQRRLADACFRGGWSEVARPLLIDLARSFGATIPTGRTRLIAHTITAGLTALWFELHPDMPRLDSHARRGLVRTLHTLIGMCVEAGDMATATYAIATSAAVAARLPPCREQVLDLAQVSSGLAMLGWEREARRRAALALAAGGLCEVPQDRAILRMITAWTYAILGDAAGAAELARQARQLQQTAPTPSLLGMAVHIQAISLLFQGEYEAAAPLIQQLRIMAEDALDARCLGLANTLQGRLAGLRGDRGAGIAFLRQALVHHQAPHLRGAWSAGAAALAWELAQGGEAERAEGLSLARQAAAAARQYGSRLPNSCAEGALLLAAGLHRRHGGAIDLRLRAEVLSARTLRRAAAVGYMRPYLLAGEALWIQGAAARRLGAARAEARRLGLVGVLGHLDQLAPLLQG